METPREVCLLYGENYCAKEPPFGCTVWPPYSAVRHCTLPCFTFFFIGQYFKYYPVLFFLITECRNENWSEIMTDNILESTRTSETFTSETVQHSSVTMSGLPEALWCTVAWLMWTTDSIVHVSNESWPALSCCYTCQPCKGRQTWHVTLAYFMTLTNFIPRHKNKGAICSTKYRLDVRLMMAEFAWKYQEVVKIKTRKAWSLQALWWENYTETKTAGKKLGWDALIAVWDSDGNPYWHSY